MRRKSVAVLDVRSSVITAVVGERGVNNTFIIKNKYTCEYDGFAEGKLIDEENFISAVQDVVASTVSSVGNIKSFYVGVPGEFIKAVNSDKVISFRAPKKITKNDTKYLADLAAPEDGKDFQTIRNSCLYYVLADKRKIIDPIGSVSDSLQGKFCFYQCSKDFIAALLKALGKFPRIEDINLIPTPYAEAMYLIEPEVRDEYAVLFDLGYISSTYSVVCGNGLAYSESFSVGVGHIAVLLMNELEIPFDVAEKYLSKVNLNAKETLHSMEECVSDGEIYKFATITLRDKIRDGLDGICETIEECRQNFALKNIDGKTLRITGEGVNVIRGTAEHISNRLVKNVEITAPAVPYYDKPEYSSLLSLLNTALSDAE